MSATFDPKIFIKYFNCSDENFISVIGSTYPIEDNFIKYDTEDYIKKSINITEELHIKNINDIDNNIFLLLFVCFA